MDDLPTDILLHKLGHFLYPFERFKLCGICKIFNRIYSIHTFKYNHSHFKYDCDYYTKFLQKYLHSGICDLSNNNLSELSQIQLKHLKYFIIFHKQLYKNYKTLLNITPTINSKHYQSLSHTLPTKKTNIIHKKTNSIVNLIESPFLNALQSINCIDLNKCASSFAIKQYNIKFICDIIQFGYFTYNKKNKYEPNEGLLGLSLKLSSNNLTSRQMFLICKALKHRNEMIDLYSLDLSLNHNISDLCVKYLFKNIGNKCNNLKIIDLSYANITDLSCDIIYNFYHKYFINKQSCKLYKIDLSFTRISEGGLHILDTLFNELPKKSIKYVHNKNHKNKSKIIKNLKRKKKKQKDTHKSQAFEIVLQGCFFSSYSGLCKNYIDAKLQINCCI